MLILCGVVILVMKLNLKIKVKLVSLTLITSISKLYYILWKTWLLKKCKLMVVNYMPVMLLILLKQKVKDVNLTVKMVNSGWNATVKKVSLVQNVTMMLLKIILRNNIWTNLWHKLPLFWTLMVLWILVKLKMPWRWWKKCIKSVMVSKLLKQIWTNNSVCYLLLCLWLLSQILMVLLPPLNQLCLP